MTHHVLPHDWARLSYIKTRARKKRKVGSGIQDPDPRGYRSEGVKLFLNGNFFLSKTISEKEADVSGSSSTWLFGCNGTYIRW